MSGRLKQTRSARTAAALLAAAAIFTSHGAASGQPGEARDAHADRWESRLDELRRRVDALDGRAGGGEAAMELSERLLDRIGADGVDLAALYGVATHEQAAWAHALAAEARSAAQRAAALIESEIRAVESHRDFSTDRAMQDRRSRLAVEMLEFRRPLAEARAALLQAAVEDSAPRRREAAHAAAAIVDGLDLRDPAWEARRLLIRGGAALLANPGDAGAAQAAIEAFSVCLELIDPGRDARLHVEAALGRGVAAMETQGIGAARAAVRAAMARPPFTPRDMRSAPWRLAAAGALYRIGLREAGRAGTVSERRDAIERASEGYVELLTRSEEGVESVRAAVYQAVAGLRWPDAPAELPTIAGLALADRAIRAGDTGRAIELLEAMIARSDSALGPLAGDALWEHARALLDLAMTDESGADELRLRAMGSLVRIGRDHADWRAAADAVESACRLGRWLEGRAPERMQRGAEALRIEALRLATLRYAHLESINQWRLDLGRLALDESGAQALTAITIDTPADYAQARHILIDSLRERMERAEGAARRDTARSILAQVDETRAALRNADLSRDDIAGWLVALDAPATAAMIELDELERATLLATSTAAEGVGRSVFVGLARRMAGAERRDDMHEARRLAAFTARVGAVVLERAGREALDDASRRWITLHHARAQTLLGRGAEAAALLEALERSGTADRAVRFWKADAMHEAGDAAGAFAIWRELAGGLEAAGEHDEIFWRCWARMLGALADRNEDGARSATIRREAARLRAIDESLGGRPHRGRIEDVLRRLDDRSN